MSTFTPEVSALAYQLADNLRDLRKAKGLTLVEMGDILGISYQQMQRYDTGESRISAAFLWWVAEKMDVPIETLFQRKT